MTEAESQTLKLLTQISQKLDTLLKQVSDAAGGAEERPIKSRSEWAREVAGMTPPSARQTDTVELLHEDRAR